VVVSLALVALLLGGFSAWRLLRRDPPAPRLANPVQVSAAIGLEDYPTWSPDGRTLAYESNETGNWDIRVAQVGAGGSVNRTGDHPGDDRYPSWSPDGRQLAFWSAREGGGYFLMPALGGPATKVAATPGTVALYHGPADWSPDGSELACVSYRPAGSAFEAVLEIVSVVTRETRRMALPGTQEARLDPRWSPDGRYLAYVDAAQQPADTTQLFVLRLPDGGATPVTDARANLRSPSWSADARALFFVSNRVGASDLWRQPMDAGAPVGPAQQLTAGLEMLHASLSPGGDRLAYAKGRSVANVWRVPLGLTRPATWADAEQVTFDQAFIEFVDVSRDGRSLAVSSDRAGSQDIWTMVLGDAGEPRRLTSDPALEWCPRFSPDGREIAFYSNRSGNREIWVMPAEGGPARQLTMHEALDSAPEWSPDGREIAFRSERSGSSDIYVVSADGHALRPVAPHPAGDYLAIWSPDGKWLAFSSNRDGAMRIWRTAASGVGEAEPLTTGPAGYSARWSRDGRHIYFVGAAERAGNYWSVALADRTERPVTAFAGRRGSPGVMIPAVSDTHLYFTWRDDLGDIWTMDILEPSAATR
jgi:Tol biopolymer transport system component